MKIFKLLLIPTVAAISQGVQANIAPVADAGADADVTVGDLVSPSGAASYDDDGDSLTYFWTLESAPSGSSVKVSKRRGVASNFTPDVEGDYTLSLDVSDGSGTDTDEVTFTASDDGGNPPNADICEQRSAGFEAYSNLVSTECVDGEFYVTTETGLPAHAVMEDISAWINRVPIPYGFTWEVPLEPTYLSNPADASLMGPIAFAVNGVPIFHYDKRPSDPDGNNDYEMKHDTILGGELDLCGGHAGQGDDYHYHYAPVCLLDDHDLSHPIAFGTDGIPIYYGSGLNGANSYNSQTGELGPDFYGTQMQFSQQRLSELATHDADFENNISDQLDECNALYVGDGSYVYYTTVEQPYIFACHRATPPNQVTNDVKALDGRQFETPQPNLQLAGDPYRDGDYGEGTVLDAETSAVVDDGNWQRLDYVGGEYVQFKPNTRAGDDCWDFRWSDASGKHTYCR